MNKIEPRLLKGFRDFSPEKQTLRQYCIDTLQEVFRKSGYQPIDTPILEYEEILLGKGGGETDKQIYSFRDNGGRNVVMRFDLTVPFARYVAMNANNLPKPFFRSQVGKVFRGENTQRGRYREFMQCDFDIIGLDHVSLDFAVLQTIVNSFDALHLPHIKIHISHRGIFNDFLLTQTPKIEISSEQVLIETLRIIDKMRKIGTENTKKLLQEYWDESCTEKIILFGTKGHTNEDTLAKLQSLVSLENESFLRLRTIYELAKEVDILDKVIIDPSITRGLDYYTGFVCETFVNGFEDIGSVCSGGRYNDLSQMFSDEQSPGVGASVGLDRLLAILEMMETYQFAYPTKNIVVMGQETHMLGYCHKVQMGLQQAGFAVHVYPLSNKLKHFFKYVEQVQADYACIIGGDEFESKTITIKNQATREQISQVPLHEAIIWINENA